MTIVYSGYLWFVLLTILVCAYLSRTWIRILISSILTEKYEEKFKSLQQPCFKFSLFLVNWMEIRKCCAVLPVAVCSNCCCFSKLTVIFLHYLGCFGHFHSLLWQCRVYGYVCRSVLFFINGKKIRTKG